MTSAYILYLKLAIPAFTQSYADEFSIPHVEKFKNSKPFGVKLLDYGFPT
jgi:hypothetical protein